VLAIAVRDPGKLDGQDCLPFVGGNSGGSGLWFLGRGWSRIRVRRRWHGILSG
jgi:hypothetical protein